MELHHKRLDHLGVKKSSQSYEFDHFKQLEKKDNVLDSDWTKETIHGYKDDAEYSDENGSDEEFDSDISTPTSDVVVEFRKHQHGSYNFIDAGDDASDDDVADKNNMGDDSDEGSTSFTDSDTESDEDQSDEDQIDGKYAAANRYNAEYYSLNSLHEGGGDNSCTLLRVNKRISSVQNSGDNSKQSSEFSPQSSLYNAHRLSRNPSYQRACSQNSSLKDISDNDYYNEDFDEVSEDEENGVHDREQFDSLKDSSGIIEETDHQGLIRKPAVRRKGYSWASKSLPRTSASSLMKQQRKRNVDSSLEIGPSLLTFYDHRIASKTGDDDGDDGFDDHMDIDAEKGLKSKTLPSRSVHSTNEDKSQRKVAFMDQTEPQDDTKKRPLSVTSSNSFTYSPRMRKKRTNEVTADNSSDTLRDDEQSCPEIDNFSNNSHSGNNYKNNHVDQTTNGDRRLTDINVTPSKRYISSENNEKLKSFKYNSKMTSSPSTPNNYDVKFDSSSPNSIDRNSNRVHIPDVSDELSKAPISSVEMDHDRHDTDSPIRQPSTGVDPDRKSYSSRHSSNSLSRHEARMKFFTNYEEYMNQSSSPQLSDAETNLHNSLPTRTDSSISSILPTSVAIKTSTSETDRIDVDPSKSRSSQSNTASLTLTPKPTAESGRDNFPKIARSSERSSRRSDRHNSNSKHEGFSTSSRTGFSRSSKKRDLAAASDPGNRSSQGYVSYVARVVTEIIESERTYITSLEDIIHGYLEPMEKTLTSNEAKKDIDCLFSNIREIYKFGCTFLADLEKSETDCVKVAQCFVKHNKGFVIYTDYCTNYPRAVEVLTRFMQHPELSELCKERQQALGHGLPLGAYLLKPVQRILKYHLLLNNILKNYEKEKDNADILEQALHHMTEMAHHINEMKRKHEHAVRIQEIQSQLEDYSGEDLTRLGELVLEGTFKVYGAKASRQVFLFQRGLLICKKNDGAMLSCKAFVLCSNLMLVEVIPNEPLSFHIIPFNNPRGQYTLQARNMEQKRLWCQNIKELILESYQGLIPDSVKNLIMKLGREHDDDYVSKEAMEAGRKNQHTAPEYLEKRKVRGKSGSRIPDFSLLRPQKAKRGDNKKGDVSPEISRRAKSKSPDRHQQMLSRQNAAKNRNSSSNTAALPVASFCNLIPNSFQTLAGTDVVHPEPVSPTTDCSSPDSPVYRKPKKSGTKSNESEKTKEFAKRPLSFLMARANPILSSDLTQLLAMCGGPVQIDCLALSDRNENDQKCLSQSVVSDDINVSQLSDTSETQNVLLNDEKDNRKEEDKHDTVASLSARISSETDNIYENLKFEEENDDFIPRSKDTDSESASSLVLKILENDADKTSNFEGDENVYVNVSNSALESEDHVYENIDISNNKRGYHHQNLIRDIKVENISEHQADNIEVEELDNSDVCDKIEDEIKKKSPHLPNTTKHSLPPDYQRSDGLKAKLTDWNSVDKLTKGSMDDLSYLDEDPWIRNYDATPSQSLSDTQPLKLTTGTSDNSNKPEIMQTSNDKENMDWLVYLNRNSCASQKNNSTDELRIQKPILNKYLVTHQNHDGKSKPSSESSYATSPRESMTFENMKKLGLIKNNNKDECLLPNKTGKHGSSSSPRKINAFGISPIPITTAKPISFLTSAGLVRSNSSPISKIKDNQLTKEAFKERPISLDIDILTESVNKTVNELKNKSSSLENVSTKHLADVPTLKVEEGEAESNRLSVISSVSSSSSSYESQSNSSSDGLVGTLKSKLNAWAKIPKSPPESENSCPSTMTSDDDSDDDNNNNSKDACPTSGNTFEPLSKNQRSWKEDRQLESVLREHSLGSSKLGSRMAHSFTQPTEQVVSYNSESSNDTKNLHQNDCSNLNKTLQKSHEDFTDSHQVKSLHPTTIETTETLMQPLIKNQNIPQPATRVSKISNESGMINFNPQNQETALEPKQKSQPEETLQDISTIPKMSKEESFIKRSESSDSFESVDSSHERKFSAVFDSDNFQGIQEPDKHEKDLKEAMLLKKSIREYVKDIEEKFKSQSPKVFEVKRREPGVMIRQRLQTLRESTLHGWRNSNASFSKPQNEERLSQLSYNDRTSNVRKDYSNQNKIHSAMKPSHSRDSLSKSVDNLAKSRDSVFISKSRESLSSLTKSRDNLNSQSESPGYRNSAPVYSYKTNNPGHERDANRFRYRTPEESQTLLQNQFVHRRPQSSSENSLLESEMSSSVDKAGVSVQQPARIKQQNEPSNETNNLVVMKGWVKSLISKFQFQ